MSKNGSRPSYKAIITPISSKYKRRKYLYKKRWRVKNTFNPRYFTTITISVPVPDKQGDKPCVFLMLHNGHTSITHQFESLGQLKAFIYDLLMNVEEDEELIDKAHSTAWEIAYYRECFEEHTAEYLQKKGLAC